MVVLLALGVRAAVAPAPIAHPDEWDPRVLDYVEWIERERGLTFDHPVYVEFLTPAEYSAYTRVDGLFLDQETHQQINAEEATLRTLGLIGPEVNLLSATNEMNDSGTLALYSFDDRTIRVRGTQIDTNLEVTLIHELVHAAQDQHFDIGRVAYQRDSGAALALLAVVEGDAEFTALRYLSQLPSHQQVEYAETTDAYLANIDLDLFDQPFMLMSGTPYSLGPALVELAFAQGGWSAVNQLLIDPPTSERELLDPRLALGDFQPVRVDPPPAQSRHDIVARSDFGAIYLYYMLASRIDPLLALEAADAWAGGSYTASTSPRGRTCVAVSVRAADDPGRRRLVELFTEWVATMPRDTLSSQGQTGDDVLLRTCGPPPFSPPSEPYTLPSVVNGVLNIRTLVLVDQLLAGESDRQAECAAEGVLAQLNLELLTQPNLEWSDLEDLIAVAAGQCAA